MGRPRQDVQERFWSKVDVVPGGCWEWTASRHHDGYGKFFIDGKSVRAHRWAYEQFVGPIPDHLVLDHYACDNRRCVRWSHLRPASRRENVLRGATRAAANLAKTACPLGHPYTETNTYLYRGRRQCQTCRRARSNGTYAALVTEATSGGPREIFREALLAGASAVFLAHNHPSGDPTPSADDRQVTRRLASAGTTLGIDVLDHLVVGAGEFISLARLGVI